MAANDAPPDDGNSTRIYKVHNYDISRGDGDVKWSLPVSGTTGAWMPKIEGDLQPYKNGYHLLRGEVQLLSWISAEIFEAEYSGDVVVAQRKIIVRNARLVRKTDWNQEAAVSFARWCAGAALAHAELAPATAINGFINIRSAARAAVRAANNAACAALAGSANSTASSARSAAAYAAYAASWSSINDVCNRVSYRKEQMRQAKKLLEYL